MVVPYKLRPDVNHVISQTVYQVLDGGAVNEWVYGIIHRVRCAVNGQIRVKFLVAATKLLGPLDQQTHGVVYPLIPYGNISGLMQIH